MPLNHLVKEANDRLREEEFLSLDEGGGVRYDSWEWNWVKLTKMGALFVTLAALEVQPGIYDVEVWSDGSEAGLTERTLLRGFESISEVELNQTGKASAEIVHTVVQAAEQLLALEAQSQWNSSIMGR